MTASIETDDALDEEQLFRNWQRPPGSLSQPLSLLVGLTLILTLALMASVLDLYYLHRHPVGSLGFPRISYQWPVLLAILACVWCPASRQGLSLSMRVCAFLPALHICLLLGTQVLWSFAYQEDAVLRWQLDLAGLFPAYQVVSGVAMVLLAVLGWRPRRASWSRRTRVLARLAFSALLFLLALGLWLPLACEIWAAFDTDFRFDPEQVLLVKHKFIAVVLMPPALLTVALPLIAGSELGRALWKHVEVRCALVSLLTMLVVKAIWARMGASSQELTAYSNFLPHLLVAATTALLCIFALGVARWLASRTLRAHASDDPDWSQEGVVISEGSVALLRYHGWLRGFAMETSGFVLRTRRGDIPIPAGWHLQHSMPASTSRALPNEAESMLKAGDQVIATGFVSGEISNAYRGSAHLVAGSGGIRVCRRNARSAPLMQDFTLSTWRLTLLYLAVALVVALPGLGGYFAY